MNDLLMTFIGEMLGTMILIILGNGVVANVLYKRTKGNNGGNIVIYLGWGFAVMVAVITAAAVKDGLGHLNPAVSTFLWVQGTIKNAGEYFTFIGGQILGAIIGQVLINIFYWNFATLPENKNLILSAHCTNPVNQNKWFNNFFAEFIGTSVLLILVAAALTPHFKTNFPAGYMLSAFIVGMTIVVIGTSLGGVTGYAINPVRDLIPRLIFQLMPFKNKGKANWSYSWVPVIAPLLSGVIIGAFARLIVSN